MTEDKLYVQFHQDDPTREGARNLLGTLRELDACPFSEDVGGSGGEGILSRCRLTKKDCRFGLTQIRVPDHCPLRSRVVLVQLRSED